MRAPAIRFFHRVARPDPTSLLIDHVVVIQDDQSLIGLPKSRVSDCNGRWAPMPSLVIAAAKADQKNVLNVGRVTRARGGFPDGAKSARSARGKQNNRK